MLVTAALRNPIFIIRLLRITIVQVTSHSGTLIVTAASPYNNV